MTARATSTAARPVIRATIDLLTGSVRYDPGAIDDWDGERWVLEARTATRDQLTEQYGADAAARFFPTGEVRAEVVLEVPIPIEMEPTERRRRRRVSSVPRRSQVSVGANT